MGLADDIVADAKADPSYRKISGEEGSESSDDAAEEGDALGEAFDALKANDRVGFKEALAAYVAGCMK